jgi:hypothetical protein
VPPRPPPRKPISTHRTVDQPKVTVHAGPCRAATPAMGAAHAVTQRAPHPHWRSRRHSVHCTSLRMSKSPPHVAHAPPASIPLDPSYNDLDLIALAMDPPPNTGEDAAHGQGFVELPATREKRLGKGTPRCRHPSGPPGLCRRGTLWRRHSEGRGGEGAAAARVCHPQVA